MCAQRAHTEAHPSCAECVIEGLDPDSLLSDYQSQFQRPCLYKGEKRSNITQFLYSHCKNQHHHLKDFWEDSSHFKVQSIEDKTWIELYNGRAKKLE